MLIHASMDKAKVANVYNGVRFSCREERNYVTWRNDRDNQIKQNKPDSEDKHHTFYHMH